jgi:hypothetical protein
MSGKGELILIIKGELILIIKGELILNIKGELILIIREFIYSHSTFYWWVFFLPYRLRYLKKLMNIKYHKNNENEMYCCPRCIFILHKNVDVI